jgi:DNA-directed RNA polymerase specialized sigma24 family protein|tara:strand:- start:9910 stop:10512 length:603 start_codon:yes stop_codon:yes gene_type:complete
MEWFEIVSQKHNDYLKIVRSFPENQQNIYIEDIVQDAYIELSQLGSKKHKDNDKRVNSKYKDLPISQRILDQNNQVNMIYMWITLKRVSMNHLKSRKRNQYIIKLGEGFDVPLQESVENEKAFEIIIDKIHAETKKWHWYDRMLFDTYIANEKSMRCLSKETKISLTSVFNTLKNCKKRLRENIGEDYLDYLYKDFELIK